MNTCITCADLHTVPVQYTEASSYNTYINVHFFLITRAHMFTNFLYTGDSFLLEHVSHSMQIPPEDPYAYAHVYTELPPHTHTCSHTFHTLANVLWLTHFLFLATFSSTILDKQLQSLLSWSNTSYKVCMYVCMCVYFASYNFRKGLAVLAQLVQYVL
jgi:hypothetical protein